MKGGCTGLARAGRLRGRAGEERCAQAEGKGWQKGGAGRGRARAPACGWLLRARRARRARRTAGERSARGRGGCGGAGRAQACGAIVRGSGVSLQRLNKKLRKGR